MSPIMSSQLITKKHYNITWSPPMHSSLHKSICFYISYSKVLKLQKWWSWWWRWWLGNNVITPESLSYRITLYLTDRHMPLTRVVLPLVYIYWYGVLVWVWFIYIGMSSLTTIIPFVEVFEFCVFLPLSPQSLAKSVIPGKANRIKAIDKYAKISLMVI